MKRYLNYIGIVGLILIVVALIIQIITGVLSLPLKIGLYLGLLLVVIFLVSKLKVLREYFSKRSAKYLTNAVVSALIIFLILFVINALSVNNNLRKDLTASSQFSLSPQTIKVLKNLNHNVQVTAFYKSDNQRTIRDLLTEYSYHSNKFKFTLIDPDKHPELARDSYHITAYGTTIVESGSNDEQITSVKEEDLTNAIVKVTRTGKKVFYFIQGHGERDIEEQIAGDKGQNGFAQVKSALEKQNFEVKPLMLLRQSGVPDDCSVLIVAGPQTSFLPNEIQMVNDYLQKGGKALFMLDPQPGWDATAILQNWDVVVHNDVVLDISGVGQLFGAGPAIPVAGSYANHMVTEGFKNVITAFPFSRSLDIAANKAAEITATKLIETTGNSWGETDARNEKPVQYNADKDFRGPLALGVVLERAVKGDTSTSAISGKQKKTRLIVFGDSDFATNAWFGFQRNSDLFMNLATWLAEEEDLVSIRPREPEDRRINLTQAQSRFILIFGVILFPAAILATGMIIYIRRKR